MEKLISVIVPVYKAEKYINQCIESIVNQTYKNLEIILIDDGSPDSCPQICDQWEFKDNRIKVIHKQNEGVSKARNSGLEVCTGDLISFVDSDDFLEENMYEKLLQLFETDHADVVACQINRYEHNSICPIKYFKYKNEYNNINYLKSLIKREIDSAPWNKLYTKKFISNSRFIPNKNNEDTLWLFYRFYDNDFKIIYTKERLYYYRKTIGSITTSKLNPHTFDVFFNAKEMNQYDSSHKQILSKELKDYTINIAIDILWNIRKEQIFNNYQAEILEIISTIRNNFPYILLSKKQSLKRKIKSLILYLTYPK